MTDPSWYDGILERVDAKDAAGFVAYLTDDVTFKWGARDPVHGNIDPSPLSEPAEVEEAEAAEATA